MYRGNKKVQVQTSFLLSRTHAQSIHKAQNTMADLGLATVEMTVGTRVSAAGVRRYGVSLSREQRLWI